MFSPMVCLTFIDDNNNKYSANILNRQYNIAIGLLHIVENYRLIFDALIIFYCHMLRQYAMIRE